MVQNTDKGRFLTNWGYKNFEKQNLDKLMFTELLEENFDEWLNGKFVIFPSKFCPIQYLNVNTTILPSVM